MDVPNEPLVITLSILGYKLNSRQNACFNYVIPSVLGTFFHIVYFAVELGCVYNQYREGNTIWAGVIILILYLPVLGCFVFTVSSCEMWPGENCSRENVRWFFVKLIEHLIFPAWSMWRCAEKIFWSIEGWFALNEEMRTEALVEVSDPRTIEFYYFLQGFLHTVPQILLQMILLINYLTDFQQETNYVAALSIVFNIIQMALTTSLYQRFKTEKVGGRQYPWFKPFKYELPVSGDDNEMNGVDTTDSFVQLRKPCPRQPKRVSTFLYCTKDTRYSTYTQIETQKLLEKEKQHTLMLKVRRRSSEGYLQPTKNLDASVSHSFSAERIEVLERERNSVLSDYDVSILRHRQADQVDFPRPIRFVKSIPEDDLVGKLVAFLWWFMFLTARFLSIASFAFFYPRHIIWILALHFAICVGYLLYDAQTYFVRHTKSVFFVFIGVIYIFCIIEFKKKFKKYKIVYNGFCALVFGENFIMCLVWRNLNDDIIDDWWFNYVFYTIIGSTLLGVMSLILYNVVNKSEKIIMGSELIEN